MERCKNWIYSKGRDLEITMYNAIFLDDKEDLLTSLTLYLGEDGGFGNQLFYNAVGTTVFETFYALKILVDCNYDLEDDGTIDDAFTYLFNNHFEITPYYAGCIGAGIKLLNKDSNNYKKCLNALDDVIKNYKAQDLESLKSYILFADATKNKEIIEKLKVDLLNYVDLSGTKPLDLINNDLLVSDKLVDLVNKNLDEILDTRLQSGAWLYPDVDDIETIKKSGTLTIYNMLKLKNFKRL